MLLERYGGTGRADRSQKKSICNFSLDHCFVNRSDYLPISYYLFVLDYFINRTVLDIDTA
jgi:hypothetical protein